ncbi:MAG TPA: ABC transporter permease [Pyrinomonadaceae bacterium]|nr:ABC transporter permease [Pyrinomonadaceae bacterium]
MDSLIKDLRYGLRSFAKRPGFTAVALVALALGIGANTAIFSLVNAVLIQPLPFPEPDRLVWAWGNIRNGGNRASVAPLDFIDYRNQNKTFEEFAATFSIPNPINLTGSGEPERLVSAAVTGNYFKALGVGPLLGRTFVLDNEKTGNDHVAVLSYRLWQKRFGGDPNIVSKTIVLDGQTSVIVGVMPEQFSFPRDAELWVPMNFDHPGMKQRKAHFLRPVGRLKPAVTLAQAQADTDAVANRMAEQYPETNTGWNLRLVNLKEQLVGNTRPTLFILLAAVGFVLLIACANVANLLLVRAASRHKEIALRTALGASRTRIIRQMITESLLLAITGGVLGIVLARWGIDLLVALSANNLPPTANVKIDGTVLGFTLLISIVTGLLFGIAPALRTMKLSVTDSLKEGGRGAGEGVSRNRTRAALVIIESAIAVVLLVGAGLLVRSLIRLQNVGPGFEAQNVLTMRLELPEKKYPSLEKTTQFFTTLEDRVAALPGVESVGFISELPMTGQPNDIPYRVDGRVTPETFAYDDDFRRVNNGYFSALRIPLLRGRNFTPQEIRDSANVIIVSDLLVKNVFPNEDPLGKRLVLAMSEKSFEIVGVVGDVRHRALDTDPSPAMYLPTFDGNWMNLVIRTTGDPEKLTAAVRREVQNIDPDQPIADVKVMNEWLRNSVSAPRYRTILLALFSLIALVLASTGIYGVMSYSVTQRTHEIGVRMALGARRFHVLQLVVRQGMVLVAIGVVLGLLLAFALTRVLASVLFNVTPSDPLTFSLVAVALPLVALLACYIPARRATRVDPLIALRYE